MTTQHDPQFEIISEIDGVKTIRCLICGRILKWPQTILPSTPCLVVDPIRLPEPTKSHRKSLVIGKYPRQPQRTPEEIEAEKSAAKLGAEEIGEPTLWKKGVHYLKALARWYCAGCPVRSVEEAAKCELICKSNICKNYDSVSNGCKLISMRMPKSLSDLRIKLARS